MTFKYVRSKASVKWGKYTIYVIHLSSEWNWPSNLKSTDYGQRRPMIDHKTIIFSPVKSGKLQKAAKFRTIILSLVFTENIIQNGGRCKQPKNLN